MIHTSGGRSKAVRRLYGLVTAGLVAASMLGTAASASATTMDGSATATFIEENMARFEVPQALRASLLEKALSGETLDADLPGAAPIAVETVINEYGTFPIKRFADGSFDSLGMSKIIVDASGNASARAVQFCTDSGDDEGHYVNNCQAYHWTLWHNMYFRFNYVLWVTGTSEITKMPAAERGFDSGNSCTTETFGITKKTGTSGSPARGDWLMACTDVVGASSSKSLGVRVSPQGATTVANY